MDFFKSRMVKLGLAVGFFLAIFFFVYFTDGGLKEYLNLKGDVDILREQLEAERGKVKALKAEIDSLKSNKAKIEKVAREEYMMKGRNEEGFEIEEK